MAIFFFVGNFNSNESFRLAKEASVIKSITLQNIPVEAKAVSVYDITENKKIYGKNDETILPIASLAKIMTVIIGLNGHKTDNIVYVSQNAVDQTGDFGIFANEKWKISDVAKFTLVVSANDGAFTLAQNSDDFLEKMNSKARKIGMENTSFYNFTGLDLDLEKAGLPAGVLTKAGALATAQDVNIMAIYALKTEPKIFSVTTMPEINLKSESGFIHNFKNTNTIINKIPNLLFSKTGNTLIAGGNFTIIFKNKNEHQIAITILGSTLDGRFSDMEKIMDVLYNM